MSDDGYDKANEACDEELGLGYIDLMLIRQRGTDEKQLYAAMESPCERYHPCFGHFH